jgi:hypothetical protein
MPHASIKNNNDEKCREIGQASKQNPAAAATPRRFLPFHFLYSPDVRRLKPPLFLRRPFSLKCCHFVVNKRVCECVPFET